jgi:[acyl-carrier-protein] S-malonyltransferase
MKTAFIFPGQGAQYIGMATDFLEHDIELKAILQEFDRVHQTPLKRP